MSAPSADVVVRDLRASDLDAVRGFWRSSGITPRPADEPGPIAELLRRSPGLSLLATRGNAIVGTVLGGFDGRRGWAYHLAVAQGSRRSGVARLLVDALESRMRARGAVEVFGLVEATNAASLAFFDATGYERREDLVVVGKPLFGTG
jgi:ribosomal protein S18 acetylase RimI-like enzyme